MWYMREKTFQSKLTRFQKNIVKKALKDKEYRRCKFVQYMREITFDLPTEFTRSQYFFLRLTLMVTGFFADANASAI